MKPDWHKRFNNPTIFQLFISENGIVTVLEVENQLMNEDI